MPSINPVHKLKIFLKAHARPDAPVLLGLSGGPDSLMLFHLLLAIPIRWGIAHIDHGWRQESRDEAKQLEALALKHQIPFHLKTLDPQKAHGNLESYCRQQRILFFKEVCTTGNYQAVLLGHHGDDQAETVLKRVFEGANLTSLGGLLPVSLVDNVTFWRPLLDLHKKDVLQWLSEKNLTAFDDATNRDPKFLRARMRTSLIPQLSQDFGKDIKMPLVKIARESIELKEFLDLSLRPFIKSIEKRDFEFFLDLSQECPSTRFEIKYLVRVLCRMADANLSYQQIDTAADLIITNASSKKLLSKDCQLSIHLRHITLKKGV